MALIKEKRLGLLPKKIEPLLFSVLPSCLPDIHSIYIRTVSSYSLLSALYCGVHAECEACANVMNSPVNRTTDDSLGLSRYLHVEQSTSTLNLDLMTRCSLSLVV